MKVFLAVSYFVITSIWYVFVKKLSDIKTAIWFSLRLEFDYFSFLEEFSEILAYTYLSRYVNCLIFLFDFN